MNPVKAHARLIHHARGQSLFQAHSCDLPLGLTGVAEPRDTIALVMKPLARYMEEAGMSVDQLIAAAGLDAKLVKAIVSGNYTPGPSERQRLSAAIGVSIEEISWGHEVPVEHMRGNGPQVGRST